MDAVYNMANRLLEDQEFTYSYDNNGNLIEKTNKSTSEVTQYTYDGEDRLIQVSKPGTAAIYRYDALGRRIEKNVNGAVTRYVYDGEDIVLEYNGSNTLIAKYTHGAGIDEPLVMERGGQSYFYQVDGLGSIAELTNSNGTVTQSYVYNSFGQILNQSGSLTNPYTYTGREFDSESGLYYYRARYYDASIGRFLQEDPIGFNGGDINLYTYVYNNAINFIDPSGLQRFTYDFNYLADANQFIQDFVRNFLPSSVADNSITDFILDSVFPTNPGDVATDALLGFCPLRIKLIQRNPAALGPHSSFRREFGDRGRITNYITFDENGNPVKRFRGTGGPHGKPPNQIYPPIVYFPNPKKGPSAPLKFYRPARPDEIPGGY